MRRGTVGVIKNCFLFILNTIKLNMSKDTARRDAENKSYLTSEINVILEPMMLEVVQQKPEN